ncbi:hypothetical protein SKAU_G00084580 [Synaphobranchus kaupii]|uniref:Uncharacterized protein n=1 Tax=Synaphobranchus kaupii TaxID=118154 RepID=A0A9Q1J3M9_SYNKA|nr:hypothetical protein SKAU_G00084580 [Synaphobranchus kaupii]
MQMTPLGQSGDLRGHRVTVRRTLAADSACPRILNGGTRRLQQLHQASRRCARPQSQVAAAPPHLSGYLVWDSSHNGVLAWPPPWALPTLLSQVGPCIRLRPREGYVTQTGEGTEAGRAGFGSDAHPYSRSRSRRPGSSTGPGPTTSSGRALAERSAFLWARGPCLYGSNYIRSSAACNL